MPGGTRWIPAMRLALEAAGKAGRRGDVPIGAVLLDADGAVVAVAGNERELTGDPTAHAEVLVLRRGAEVLSHGGEGTAGSSVRSPCTGGELEDGLLPRSWRFEQCTLVVTLEPCTMCAGAIVNARVGRLVFGAFDPKAGAVSSLRDVVRDPRLNHRVEVTSGVLDADCAALLRGFFETQRSL